MCPSLTNITTTKLSVAPTMKEVNIIGSFTCKRRGKVEMKLIRAEQ
jgi:hypothetical protein